MAFALTVGDVVELKIYCSSGNQFSINTFHFLVTELGGAGVTETALTTLLSATVPALYKAFLPASAAYEGMSAQIIRPTRRPKVTNTVGAGVGAVDAEVLPRQVAGLGVKLTDIANRHGRGRTYLPFFTEDHNTATGTPSAAALTAIQDVMTALCAPLTLGGGGNTADVAPVIYDRVAHTVEPITSTTVRVNWGTCRRRADIRGADRAPF